MIENTRRQIEECEFLYAQVKDRTTLAFLDLLNTMRAGYETLGEKDNCIIMCDYIINLIATYNYDRADVPSIMLSAYDSKARLGDFRAYCIALEWNRPVEKQFFIPSAFTPNGDGLNDIFYAKANFEPNDYEILIHHRSNPDGSGIDSLDKEKDTGERPFMGCRCGMDDSSRSNVPAVAVPGNPREDQHHAGICCNRSSVHPGSSLRRNVA